jgi:exodeoxyribonuclease-1
MLDWRQRTPLIHVSQRFPAERGCLAVVVPVALHPSQGGKIIVVDAHHDPTPLLNGRPRGWPRCVFAPADTPGRVPLGLKLVHANRAPFLAPISVLKGVDLQRIRMDRAAVDRHCEQLRGADGLDRRLQQVYRLLDQQPQTSRDADGALYDGFIADADRALARKFAQADAAERAQIAGRFSDTRLAALALRFRGRHHEAGLDPIERRLWLEHCRSQLQRSGRTLADYRAATTALAGERRGLADDLLRWADRVSAHAMAR